jgi:hypothetical protein
MAARQAVATRVAAMLETPMKSGPYTLLPAEAVLLAVKERQWQPTDLYKTLSSGSWDTPVEVLKNKKGDTAALLCKWEELNKASGEMSLFRYTWRELPDVAFGLAATRSKVFPAIDLEKAKLLGEKVGADALLYVQVSDMDVHVGSTLFEAFKSTRLYLQCMLIAPADGAVLWQARVRSIHSHKAGFFTGAGAFQAEMGMAIESGTDGFKALLDDLHNGTGQPVKQETKP